MSSPCIQKHVLVRDADGLFNEIIEVWDTMVTPITLIDSRPSGLRFSKLRSIPISELDDDPSVVVNDSEHRILVNYSTGCIDVFDIRRANEPTV